MKWVTLGMRMLPFVITAVEAVERAVAGFKKGKEKQDLALNVLITLIESVEGIAGKDLINNDKVQKAARHLIDAVVAFQNALAEVKK